MSFSVLSLMYSHDTSDTGMNSFGFRQYFESYRLNFMASSKTRTQFMQPIESVRYKGDLGGWLLTIGIGIDYHWVIGRLNGYLDPAAYDGNRLNIQIPSLSDIDNLLLMYKRSLT